MEQPSEKMDTGFIPAPPFLNSCGDCRRHVETADYAALIRPTSASGLRLLRLL
jgi:hypothetical protein